MSEAICGVAAPACSYAHAGDACCLLFHLDAWPTFARPTCSAAHVGTARDLTCHPRPAGNVNNLACTNVSGRRFARHNLLCKCGSRESYRNSNGDKDFHSSPPG